MNTENTQLLLGQAGPRELELAFEHRAEVPYWRGRLSREEYLERTRRIFTRHPFGRERVRVWTLSAGDELVVSMDVLDVEFLLSDGSRTRVPLITSLVTPASQRKRGRAAELLRRFQSEIASPLYFLYSDIDPAYYEKQGYVRSGMVELLAPAGRGSHRSSVARAISPTTFIGAAREECAERMRADEGGAVCLPDELFLDWHLERYRFFAELRRTQLPHELCWTLEHQSGQTHALCLVPDRVENQLEALWLSGDCAECIAFARAHAADLGLESLRYWAAAEAPRPAQALVSEHGCVPMLRTGDGVTMPPVLVTPKICTWF